MERLAVVIPNVYSGGAARVAATLCGEWVESGHEVHLLTFEQVGAAPFYPLDPRIVRHQIGLNVSPSNIFGFVVNNAARVVRLGRTLRRISPTAVLSFLLEANVTTVAAARGLGVPVLISERNHPGHDRISAVKDKIRRVVYPRASRLCVQTEDIRRWFLDNLALDAAVIPNPVQTIDGPPTIPTASQAASGRRRVVSLGRLEPQKGFDQLIDAFALIHADASEWDLVIFGEGGQRVALERQIADRGLERHVHLPGATREPAAELAAANLYVHAARYEGFSNAIIEALAAGLCVVATDCPGATSEILAGGAYGVLTPHDDVDALAKGMLRAIRDQSLRASFAERAPMAIGTLVPKGIAERWLSEVAACRRRNAV